MALLMEMLIAVEVGDSRSKETLRPLSFFGSCFEDVRCFLALFVVVDSAAADFLAFLIEAFFPGLVTLTVAGVVVFETLSNSVLAAVAVVEGAPRLLAGGRLLS